jgi:hypothetical protein
MSGAIWYCSDAHRGALLFAPSGAATMRKTFAAIRQSNFSSSLCQTLASQQMAARILRRKNPLKRKRLAGRAATETANCWAW